MSSDSVFRASAVERRAVADLLDTLDEAQLATASLCAGWDVRTVGAHLAGAVRPSVPALASALLRSGGNLHRANQLSAREAARRPVAEIARTLRDNAGSRFSPPVVGARGPLTDVLVHAGDIRVPLGMPHEPALGHVRMSLDFLTGGRPVGFVPRGTLRGLRLVATDLAWSSGDGATVSGRGIDLAMAVCGRSAVLDRLGGAGLPVLRHRLGAAAGG